jgi:hypothetical protein
MTHVDSFIRVGIEIGVGIRVGAMALLIMNVLLANRAAIY